MSEAELKDLLKESIFHLRIDRSDIHHDLRDYERLDEKDYDSIVEDLLPYINQNAEAHHQSQLKANEVSYQTCPICGGKGWVRPGIGSTNTMDQCTTCQGQKIIPKINLEEYFQERLKAKMPSEDEIFQASESKYSDHTNTPYKRGLEIGFEEGADMVKSKLLEE